MNCETCDLHVGEFHTNTEYAKFQSRLQAALNTGAIVQGNSYAGVFDTTRFKCANCKRAWMLAVPHDKFTGGWDALSG